MKIKSIIFLLLLVSHTLSSVEFLSELRGGYFYPNSEKFRKIYNNGGPEVELEFSGTFCESWTVWGNVNYFQRDGDSIGLFDRTNIRMIPLSLGAKYQFEIDYCISPYIGAGVTYTYTQIHNHSDFVKKHVNKNGVGGVVKSGIYIPMTRIFTLDIFLDWYYQQLTFSSHHKANVGGFRAGIGVASPF